MGKGQAESREDWLIRIKVAFPANEVVLDTWAIGEVTSHEKTATLGDRSQRAVPAHLHVGGVRKPARNCSGGAP